MPSGALIDTNNRLLGWSTNDFSLYGGQAAVTIGAPATSPRLSDGLSIPDPAADSRSPNPQAAPEPNIAMAADQAIAHADEPSAFSATPFAPSPIQFGGLTHANQVEAGVPASTGSGSPILPVETLHAPSMAADVFTPPTLAVEQPEAQAPTLAPVGGLAAPLLANSEALEHIVAAVGTTSDALLAETQHAVDALPGVIDSLFQNSGLTALDGFLGTDPAGGVATLVSMVDSTDAFDLSHAGLDIPQLTPSGSILDTLTDDAVAGPLLGDVAHQADSLVPDHHHDGVLGIL